MLKLSHIFPIESIFHLISKEQSFQGFCHDHRLLQPGEIFIALPGQKTHGIHFANEAISKGAVAILADHEVHHQANGPKIIVKDVFKTILDAIKKLRTRYNFKIAAITGSYGKTTTKEYLKTIYSQVPHTVSFANWNNSLGLSVNLSRLNFNSPYNVFECGISENLEMDLLQQLLCPEIVAITSIGPAHLQGLKSLQNIANEKLKLAKQALYLLITRDVAQYVHGNQQYFICGLKPEDDFYLKKANNQYQFFAHSHLVAEFEIIQESRCFLEQFCQALAIAYLQSFDFSLFNQITINAPAGRGRVLKIHDYELWDETYNANPISMSALLDDLETHQKPSILVMDDMLELGDQQVLYEQQLAKKINLLKKTKVFYIGQNKQFWEQSCMTVSLDDLVKILLTQKHSVVAFKASRGKKIEQAMNYFIENIQVEASLP